MSSWRTDPRDLPCRGPLSNGCSIRRGGAQRAGDSPGTAASCRTSRTLTSNTGPWSSETTATWPRQEGSVGPGCGGGNRRERTAAERRDERRDLCAPTDPEDDPGKPGDAEGRQRYRQGRGARLPRIVFGVGRRAEIPALVATFGRRALPSVAPAAARTDRTLLPGPGGGGLGRLSPAATDRTSVRKRCSAW